MDLWDLSQNGPVDVLNQTENTQPVLLTAGIAVWRAWLDQGGGHPLVLAGHSLGEYSALVAADVLSLEDAVVLVKLRGQLMQAAVPSGEGAMAAIMGLELADLESVCKQASELGVVSPANINAPGQIVIAGSAKSVEKAIEIAKEQGAKRAMALAVSVPSHCALMKSAAEQMSESLAKVTFSTAQIPVIHNVDAKIHSDPDAIREALVRQLHEPVQWIRCIHSVINTGATRILECGPGKVLSGLMRRIDRSVKAFSLAGLNDFQLQLGEIGDE